MHISRQAGRVLVYCGKNGRKMVPELKGAPAHLVVSLEAAWQAAGVVLVAAPASAAPHPALGAREADYARLLAGLTERWVAYADANIDWAPVRQRLTDLAGRLGQPAPDSAAGPDAWRKLALRLVKVLEGA